MKQVQPNTKAKANWQRKLSVALMAGVFAVAPVRAAFAFITDTVVANGTVGGQPISATATANVDVADAVPNINLQKLATLNDGGDGSADPGDTITYTFSIKNTGNTTLQNIVVSDPTATIVGTAIASLAPGATDTSSYTATHIITPADIASGQYANTATVNAHSATGQDIASTASVSTVLNVVSSLSLVKSGVQNLGTNGRADAGDTITYSFVVTNTGPTVINTVKVSDPLVNLASLPNINRSVALLDASLQPADPIMTASIDSKVIDASIVDTPVAPTISQLPLAADLNVQRQIVRMSGDTETIGPGDKIGFVYGLYNTGDIPFTSINVDQQGAVAYGSMLDILAPNAQDSASLIYTRRVTAEEVAAGEIIAPATVTIKSRGVAMKRNVIGKEALVDVKTYDSFVSASISPVSFPGLNPGQSTTFTANYTLTQADVDAGVVNNTATASAKNTAGQTLQSVASNSQTLLPTPGISVLKTSSLNLGLDNVASLGDVITYQFAVYNTGNVTLSPVTLTDDNGTVSGSLASLSPGQNNQTAFSATHILTQADLDAGQVENQATVHGKSPTNIDVSDLSDPVSLLEDNPTITTLTADPKIALLKQVTSVNDINLDGFTNFGDTITYGFTVKNIGNVTLTNVIVTDPKITVLGAALPIFAPNAIDSTHFTGTYTITQADMDLGHVDNTALVDSLAPDGITHIQDSSDPGVFTQNGPTTTTFSQVPKIALLKKVNPANPYTDTNNDTVLDAGDVIHYIMTVSNPGNVTLTNVNVVDNLAGATVTGGPLASLAPGAVNTNTFTADYIVTAADMTSGTVSNVATAYGKPPLGPVVSDLSDPIDPTKNNPTVTAISPIPALAVIKKIIGLTDRSNGGLSTVPDGITNAGDIINYTFEVKNTGNVNLTNVYVTDGNANIAGAHIPTLLAGYTDTTTFTGNHVITPADIVAGTVLNQAMGFGTAPNGTIRTDLSDDDKFTENDVTTYTFPNAPAIALVKTVSSISDVNGNTFNDVGDVINYTLTVTNVGNALLKNIYVTDPKGVVAGGPLATLAVGASNATTFTASHVITPADVTAGTFENQATAHSVTSLSLGDVKDDSDASSTTGSLPTITVLSLEPAVALIKTVKSITDKNGNGVTDVGDEINYGFVITNTGAVDLTNLVLTDGNATLSPNPAVLPLLQVAQVDSTSFTAIHKITAADAARGFVSNTAYVNGKSVKGTAVADTSDKSSVSGSAPTITPVVETLPVLTKTASKSEVARGETVTYTITATNLAGGPFQLTDIMPPGFGYVSGSASVNGVAATPVINERNLAFPGLTPLAGKLVLKLKLLASTTLGGGQFINNAQLIDPATGNVIGRAQATVTIKDEAVFDCSDIIGHVFDDKNHNGYMDAGEPGLPGVRVVTLNGVLITTDSEGRFHVPCVAIPDASIGSNFLMKLDTRTLPTGYEMTTENPRDVRITRGKVTEINFGAAITHEVRVDVTGKAFDRTDLTSKWATGIDRLFDILCHEHSTLLFVYHRGGESKALAESRLATLEDTMRFAWKNGQCGYKLKISSRVEDGK
jgi:uncharacterized repeat protein (TIGR01451 family)